MVNLIEFIRRSFFSGVTSSYILKILLLIFISLLIFYYIEKLSELKFFKSILKKLDDFNPKKAKLGTIIFLLSFILLSLWQILRHYRFNTFGLDFGLFSQSLWYHSQLQLPRSSIRGFENLYGDHFTPFMYLLVPFVWILQSEIVLLLLQPLAIAFGTFYLYKWALEKYDYRIATLLSFFYFSFIGHQLALSFDFHPIVLFSPLVLVLLKELFYKKEPSNLVLIFTTLLSLLIQEDLAIIVFYFYLIAFVNKLLKKLNFKEFNFQKLPISTITFCRQNSILILFIIVSVGYYLFVSNYIINPNRPSNFSYFDYPALGKDFQDAIKNLSTRPLSVISAIFADLFNNESELRSYLQYLMSTGFVLFFSPISTILSILPFFVKYLNPGPFISSNSFHYLSYHFGLAVFGFFAILDFLKSKSKTIYKFGIIFLSITILTSAYIEVNIYLRSFESLFITQSEIEFQQQLTKIDKNKSIVASNPVVAHISKRQNVNVMCHNDRKTLPSIESPDVIIIFTKVKGSFPCSPEYEDLQINRSDYRTIFENNVGVIRERI